MKTVLTPRIFNCHKKAGESSYDVIRSVKQRFRKTVGKIGHFGTLDPFASGVLMVGVAGAARLNNYIHEYGHKTYLAKGLLGKKSETGDMTGLHIETDESSYLVNTIAKFEKSFIEQQLREKFLGVYMQSPHSYSAAKFKGKALHKWAREGVTIQKPLVQRHIYQINVIEYNFPNLDIEIEVSSGTYIRVLFEQMANYLGTLGVLNHLIRTKVGKIDESTAIQSDQLGSLSFSDGLDVRDVLDFGRISFAPKEANLFINGVRLKQERALDCKVSEIPLFWVESQSQELLGVCEIIDGEYHSRIRF